MSTTFPHGVSPSSAPVGTPTAEETRREVAIARLKRKRKFTEDLFAYLGVNGILWLIWALTDHSADGGLPWPAWVSLIWGFLLALDAWRAFGRGPRGADQPITEAEIEREIERTHPG